MKSMKPRARKVASLPPIATLLLSRAGNWHVAWLFCVEALKAYKTKEQDKRALICLVNSLTCC